MDREYLHMAISSRAAKDRVAALEFRSEEGTARGEFSATGSPGIVSVEILASLRRRLSAEVIA